MKKCFLYPGQGAQYPGMGKDLYDYSEKIKKLFKTASDSTGINLEKLLFEGSEDDLKQTDKTQVAVTLVNIASSILLKEKGIENTLCAGFSLGEVAAFWDAGIIETDILFYLVKERGRIMEKASRFVKFQAIQALGIGIVRAALSILLQIFVWILTPRDYYSALNYLSGRGWGAWVVLGIISTIIGIAITIIILYVLIKSYGYKQVELPIIGPIAKRASEK